MATRLIIKNSSVAGKVPVAGDLSTAELALNTADKLLYSKDAAGNVFQVSSNSGEVPSGGTGDRPDSPSTGDLYFDTDLGVLLVYNGSGWEEVGSKDPAALEMTAELAVSGANNACLRGGTRTAARLWADHLRFTPARAHSLICK